MNFELHNKISVFPSYRSCTKLKLNSFFGKINIRTYKESYLNEIFLKFFLISYF